MVDTQGHGKLTWISQELLYKLLVESLRVLCLFESQGRENIKYGSVPLCVSHLYVQTHTYRCIGTYTCASYFCRVK